jgi:IS30 family transposase
MEHYHPKKWNADLIGPHKTRGKRKKVLTSWSLTMINPVTPGWFELAKNANKTAAEVVDVAEKTWFTRHPLPQRITLDRGTEFMAEFAKMGQNDHGIKLKPTRQETRKPMQL